MIETRSHSQLNPVPVVYWAGMTGLLAACLLACPAVGEPELTLTCDAQPAHPGRPFRVVCEVTWSGEPDGYVIMPAEVEKIDWGGVEVSESRSMVRDGRNVVSQTVIITPHKAGDFMAPGIRIASLSPESLTPPEQSGPPTHPTAPEAPPQLRAEPFALNVRPDRTLTWLSGALGALFLSVGAITVFVARRKRRSSGAAGAPSGSSAQSSSASFESALHESLRAARQSRIDGGYYAYYQHLAQAASVLPGAGDLSARLAARAQEVGYRGIRPPDDELDADLRALERVYAAHKEATEP